MAETTTSTHHSLDRMPTLPIYIVLTFTLICVAKRIIKQLKGKHDEKSSPIFMSLSCSYVCMHTPHPKKNKQKKNKPSKNLSPLRYGQLNNYFLLWKGLYGDSDRGNSCLGPYCKNRVWVAREMCCSWPQEWWAPIASRIVSERNEPIK